MKWTEYGSESSLDEATEASLFMAELLSTDELFFADEFLFDEGGLLRDEQSDRETNIKVATIARNLRPVIGSYLTSVDQD